MSKGKGGGGDADGMVQAGDKAIDLQKQIYEQSRADSMPWLEAGKTGLSTLLDRLGLSGNTGAEGYGSLMKTFSADDFQKDPGYDFRLGEGNKALSRQLAASGKYLAPSGAKALDEYNQNFASNEYMNAYNRFNNDNSTIYDRLAGLSGTGQAASGQLAGIGSNYANNTGDIYMQQANAQAAAAQAARNRGGSFINTLISGGAQAAPYFFSDIRLKENVSYAGTENGHNIYAFNYLGDPHRYVGVIAQEILATNPEAVCIRDNGYLAVDYDRIGVDFRSVH